MGIAGMVIVLGAYLLELFEKVKPTNLYYLLANIAGSGLLMWYAYTLESVPFMVLNAVWAGGAVIELIRLR